jgi:hypothetical protein
MGIGVWRLDLGLLRYGLGPQASALELFVPVGGRLALSAYQVYSFLWARASCWLHAHHVHGSRSL